MDMRAAAARFAPEGTYLDTATVGLPPDVAVEAARLDLDRWQAGLLVATEYDALIQRSRRAYALLVGASADRVGIVSLDLPGAVDALRAADIACAGRDGRLRLACHLYVTERDVDHAITVLRDAAG